MKKLLVWSLAIVILLFVSGFLFVTLSPVFGGKPDEQTRARMLASDNFKDDIFVNRHPVSDKPHPRRGVQERPQQQHDVFVFVVPQKELVNALRPGVKLGGSS